MLSLLSPATLNTIEFPESTHAALKTSYIPKFETQPWQKNTLEIIGLQ
jgi:hypothetical protein